MQNHRSMGFLFEGVYAQSVEAAPSEFLEYTECDMVMRLASIVPAVFLLFIQISPSSSPDLISNLDRITLAGAAILACGVLWRSLGKKDESMFKMVETVTASLTAATDSNKELRKIIEENVGTNRQLSQTIERLESAIGNLPCTEIKPDKRT